LYCINSSAQKVVWVLALGIRIAHSDLISGGGRRQESEENMCEDVSLCETLMERLAGDVPVTTSLDTTQEEELEESSSASFSKRQSVIRQPGGPGTPQPSTGTKRPHPDYEDDLSPECSSSVGRELEKGGYAAGSPTGQDPGTSAVGCSVADEPGAFQGKPYPCSECGEAFAWISHLIDHHRSHSSKKHYASQGC
jgi:uncharacterized Zn-finger protein